MRILFDQAVYDQRNNGNVALLQTAVRRIGKLWPEATLYVLTEAPYLLKLYCPKVIPVGVRPWQNWSQKRGGLNGFYQYVPGPVLQWLLNVREEVWHRYPNLLSGGWRGKISSLFRNNRDFKNKTPELVSKPLESIEVISQGREKSEDFLRAIHAADLIIATGGGYICDTDKQYSLQVYDTLETAIRSSKPVVMVGQGVGPLHDPELRSRLNKILPYLDLILIREPKVACPLFDSLGVAPDRIMMTGDDAIEMAYEARPSGWGNYIGVNLRLAIYTEVERAYIDKVRKAIQQSARKFKSPLMALPTSCNIKEADLEIIREMLKGYEKVLIDWRRFFQPLDMIHQIGRCRLVVTGSYHPAVYALAQGIPAVGLVKSKTYIDKFSALQDEFGPALQILHLDDAQLAEKLEASIETAWANAENDRPQLLQAAVRQIGWGQAGYRRLYDLVMKKLAI